MTPENFGKPGWADYWNPNLSEAMAVLKYTRKFGSGIELVRKMMEHCGNPPPEFIVDRTHVRVVLHKRPNPVEL